jgi:hypothetical protein
MARTTPPKQPDKNADAPAEPARRGRALAVSGDINLAAQAAFARAGFSDPSLVLRWREIAGPEINRIARPLKFQEQTGVLTLLAEPGAALFLGHDSRQLAARINTYLGRPAVTRIKFVQGAITPPAPLPRPIQPKAAPSDDDPVNKYGGPDTLKSALKSLARWRS